MSFLRARIKSPAGLIESNALMEMRKCTICRSRMRIRSCSKLAPCKAARNHNLTQSTCLCGFFAWRAAKADERLIREWGVR